MRGQIQFGESIAIVIVLVVMIVIGIVFYSRLEQNRNAVDDTTRDDIRAIEVAKLAGSLPELKCTGTSAQDKTCIDSEKANVFKNEFEKNRLHYVRIFGDSVIKLSITYPEEDKQEITLMQTANSGKTLTPVHIPINVYDPKTRTTKFGYLEVLSGG